MSIRRILFPTDFSELSKPAEKFACELADQFVAELHVLHVLHDFFMTMPWTASALLVPPELLNEVTASAEVELRAIPPKAWSFDVNVVRVVRTGSTYDTIVKYVTDNAIDLIVIGTHGRTGIPRVLLGSLAERVVQHATCPVLTVRSGSRTA